jgi:GNAT superfamily N-acetyltransferase
MSIEVTMSHRRFWWQIDDEDQQPVQWRVSADVSGLDVCPDGLRHVGDIEVVTVDLTAQRTILDTVVLGEWALPFFTEALADLNDGTLHPDLEGRLSAGPPRMAIVRRISLAQRWQGLGLAAPLLASALRIVSPNVRWAACRVSLEVSGTVGDLSPGLRALRFRRLLERIGFSEWHDVHVSDLQDTALLDARIPLMERWWPANTIGDGS